MREEVRYCKKCGAYMQDHYTYHGMCGKCLTGYQDQLPNFMGEDGKFYLLKCFKCKKYSWREGEVLSECPVCKWKLKEEGNGEEGKVSG